MKEAIEQELARRGYTVVRWRDTLKNGWGIEVVRNDRYSLLYAEEIFNEILERELR